MMVEDLRIVNLWNAYDSMYSTLIMVNVGIIVFFCVLNFIKLYDNIAKVLYMLFIHHHHILVNYAFFYFYYEE